MDLLKEKKEARNSLEIVKKELIAIIDKIEELGSTFPKTKYNKMAKEYLAIMFKSIKAINKHFSWKNKDILILISSFVLWKNVDFYNIDKKSLFYHTLKNHITAFKEFLISQDTTDNWIPIWTEYISDFEVWKEEDRKLVSNSLIENYNKLRNDIILQPPNVNVDELIDKSKPLLQKIQDRINKHATEEEKEKMKFTPVIYNPKIIEHVKTITEKVLWDTMKEDLKKPISEWNYAWSLFEDLYVMFLDLVPHSEEAKIQIKDELETDKWKDYILKHDVKEHAIKEYLTAVNTTFEMFGVPSHKERYRKCISECIEIISTLSYSEAIPTIFKKLFKECETLFITANMFRLKINQRIRK
jgi:hypothetical protein